MRWRIFGVSPWDFNGPVRAIVPVLEEERRIALSHERSSPMHFEFYKDAANEWRWNLHAANGRIIADSSEGYKNRGDMMRGISLVKGSASIPMRPAAATERSQALARALLNPSPR
jgi:uncharacterized protein YegP (UPF0339 family)